MYWNYNSGPGSLKLNFLFVQVYDRPVQLPYYGNISMEFGSGYTMKWPITGTMTAQDGR